MLYIYLHALASLIDMAYETQFYVILKIKIEITRNKINIKKTEPLFICIVQKGPKEFKLAFQVLFFACLVFVL